MSETKYDKKKLIILRAALILLGACLGGTALWQYFVFYPDVVRAEFRIVITVVTAALAALLLGLSAKPFYNLFVSIGGIINSTFSALGGRGITAALLGLFAAGIFTFVIDVLVRTVYNIWAVRLLIDVLVFILFAALCCYGFTQWLTDDADETNAPPPPRNGYLLSAESLFDERVLSCALALTNVKALDCTYKALLLMDGDGNAAAKRFGALTSDGRVSVLRCNSDFNTPDEYRAIEKRIAASKRLRLVTVNGDSDESELSLSLFASPSVVENT